MSLSVNLDIAKRLDIICRKGDTFSLELVMKDSSGLPIDVSTPSAYTFSMQVKESSDSVAIINTSASGFTITGNSEGRIVITASGPDVMSGVDSGLYVYDFQSTNAFDGVVQTWFYGTFKVNDQVTE